MPKLERHYRTVSRLFARRNGDEIYDGYESAYRGERLPAVIDKEPSEYFAGARFCKEDYEHVRAQLANSKAWSIGWAVAQEALRDAVAPAQTLAELFKMEKYA